MSTAGIHCRRCPAMYETGENEELLVCPECGHTTDKQGFVSSVAADIRDEGFGQLADWLDDRATKIGGES